MAPSAKPRDRSGYSPAETEQVKSLCLTVAVTLGALMGELCVVGGLVPSLLIDQQISKSTCLQGIIYALGLEGMLNASRAIPLPHVATASLTDESDGRELGVLESYVMLEFENDAGQVATVRRYAKHGDIDTQLITVWEAPMLSSPTKAAQERAYFVRRPGAAQRQAGFHRWFAEFLGWVLPEVPRYDGTLSPLYLETIFPLLFVEQKHGWAGIQAQTPTYLRIRDVGRRNVEFVLALSGGDLATQRQLLQERIGLLRQQWTDVVKAFRIGADELGIVVRGIPEQPARSLASAPRPTLWLPSTENPDEWQPLSAEVDRLAVELSNLNRRVIPRAEDAAPGVSEQMQASLQELREMSDLADALHREVAIEEDQVRSLESRIASLQDDVRRSQDAEILREMGAPVSAVMPPDCPTCHQALPSTLLDPAAAIVPMPIGRNIALLKEQIELFRAMRADLHAAIMAKRQQLVAFDERVQSLQQAIRAQRETLVSASGTPSIDDIERRVHLRDRIEALKAVSARLGSLTTALAQMAQAWSGLLEDQGRLRELGTPQADRDKINALQASFLSQLGDYGFTSLPIGELNISEDTYLPTYEGFDLGFDLSASDMIRTIWAHRMGLLEVARSFDNRHAQLLVFDEPRQQSTDPLSFIALFERAGRASSFGQQIIFATSEPEIKCSGHAPRGSPSIRCLQGKDDSEAGRVDRTAIELDPVFS